MTHIPSLDSIHNLEWNFQPSQGSFFQFGSNAAYEPGQLLPIESQSKQEARVRTINTEMASMGFPSMLIVEDDQVSVIVDVLFQNMLRLLDSYMKNLSVKSELDSRLRRVEGDLTLVQKLHKKCQDNLTESQNANAVAKERERRLELEKKTLNGRLKATTEELRKLQLNIQRYETQATHERRKLERENVALRERLSSSLSRPSGNTSPRRQSSQQGRFSVSSRTLSGSLVSLNTDSDAGEIAPRRTGAQAVRTIPKSPVLRRFSGKSLKPSVVSANSTAPPLRGNESKLAKRWTVYDTASVAANEGGSQADLYALIVQQLEERQNTLLYENRELRDVVSQMASRLVRFTNFIERNKQPSEVDGSLKSKEHPPADGELDSLDEDTDEDQLPSLNHGSSDEDEAQRDGQLQVPKSDGHRRQSANVNNLLLQLPYALVREHVMQRVRQLSRRLWRQLKTVRGQQGAHDLSSSVENAAKVTSQLGSPLDPDSPDSPDSPIEPVPSLAKTTKPEDLETEVAKLKHLVSKYESRIKEQDIALRHVLFSSSRRWNGLGYSDSFDRDLDVNRPERRSSLFKLSSTVFTPPKDGTLSNVASLRSSLPKDGTGDHVPPRLFTDPQDTRLNTPRRTVSVTHHERPFAHTDDPESPKSVQRKIEIQHVKSKQGGYSSDVSD